MNSCRNSYTTGYGNYTNNLLDNIGIPVHFDTDIPHTRVFKNSMLNELLPDCITSSLYSQGPSFFPTVGHKLGTTDLFASSERKIFSKIRVQSNVATHIQESIKSIQRYCNNSFMGVTKQQAIDIFLGNFRPEVVEMTSSKSSSDQKENCGCLKALYLKNLSRLGLQDDAHKRGSRFLTGPSGRSRHDSNEG
ncbi:phosphoinositide phosphatase SAC4-like isoform X2 [Beta vulgaris subsp. vulgaris]|uniref:phosphoinositide phosphatase SAC4-like isoform X2 n=1 Tax=Beta vulgaris subsp. vulgaris TaxID=3555 RepID=UPI0020366C25|nr:phosphoinositide phosphatase SAC4-like isoform X2 [Beta vulgaris subsp. vulgaris]XP_057248572.1 phosphoinositide phosphatase SAC4-like isoform X2 [Beta vulgaris subsp. vulgaris]